MKLLTTIHYILTGVAFLVAAFLFSPHASAHSGRTNSMGCHNDYIHGGYHCHNSGYYNAPVQTWSCTIGVNTYYSTAEAKARWSEDLRASVDTAYKSLLERASNENDYSYWESKFPFNNCNYKIDTTLMWNEVKSSDERKSLLVKKEADRTALADQKTTSSSQPIVESVTNTDDGSETIFWVIVICILVIVGLYYAIFNKSNKP